MKIKKINKIILEDSNPVYDITVPEYHNFLLEAGIFAHNCDHPQTVIGGWCQELAGKTVAGSKDVSDAVTQLVYAAFTNPIQTNIMDLANSIQKTSLTQNSMVKPAYYNTYKRPMTQQEAMKKALALFAKR